MIFPQAFSAMQHVATTRTIVVVLVIQGPQHPPHFSNKNVTIATFSPPSHQSLNNTTPKHTSLGASSGSNTYHTNQTSPKSFRQELHMAKYPRRRSSPTDASTYQSHGTDQTNHHTAISLKATTKNSEFEPEVFKSPRPQSSSSSTTSSRYEMRYDTHLALPMRLSRVWD